MTVDHDTIELRHNGVENTMFVNGGSVSWGRHTAIQNWLRRNFHIKRCRYCSQPVRTCWFHERSDDHQELTESYLWYCKNCRFWQAEYYSHEEEGSNPESIDSKRYISKLKEFDSKLPAGCLSEIAQFIRQRPSVLNSYDPKQFEKLIANVLKANHAYADVTHVGKPADGGVDVFLVDSDQNEWLVQVKRRSDPEKAESVGTVRNLLGAMLQQEKKFGMVVSSADHFSHHAEKAISDVEPQGYTVQLVDKGKVSRLLDPVLPDRPWLQVLKDEITKPAQYFAEKIPSHHQRNIFELVSV